MSQFLHFLGASRGCADFRDPTAVFRFIEWKGQISSLTVARCLSLVEMARASHHRIRNHMYGRQHEELGGIFALFTLVLYDIILIS